MGPQTEQAHRRYAVARLRFAATTLALLILIIATQPPKPAAAYDSYATYNGGSFVRIPDGQPIMTMQQTCVYCVASGTQAWIDYVRLVNGQNSRPSQSEMWNSFATANGAWGAPYDTSLITR